jgi:hypothetical protein
VNWSLFDLQIARGKRTLAYLIDRCWGRVFQSGQHIVPDAALEAIGIITPIVAGGSGYMTGKASINR